MLQGPDGNDLHSSVWCLNMFSGTVWNGMDTQPFGHCCTNLEKSVGMLIDTHTGRFMFVIAPRHMKKPAGWWMMNRTQKLQGVYMSSWYWSKNLANREVKVFFQSYGKASVEIVHHLHVPCRIRCVIDSQLQNLVNCHLPASHGLPKSQPDKRKMIQSPLPLGPISPTPSIV